MIVQIQHEAPKAAHPRPGLSRYAAWIVIFAAFVVLSAITWQRWGDVQIDCGREMYLPSAILAGKMLYRDLLYNYGPLAPYWNALLFRVFGERLSTLYFSGLAVTFCFVVVLFAVARRLISRTAALVVSLCFLVQAFQPGLFNYVLPYSFAATLGALFSLIVVHFLVRHALTEPGPNLILAGLATGFALITKMEFGLAAILTYSAFAFCDAIRKRSFQTILRTGLSLAPGLALAAAVYGWFMWRLTPPFMIHENLWPAYFLKAKGAFWLKSNGSLFNSFSPGQAVHQILWFCLTVLLCVSAGIAMTKIHPRWALLPAALVLGEFEVLAYRAWKLEFYFPRGIYWIAIILLAWLTIKAFQARLQDREMAQWIVAAAAVLIAARIATKVATKGYAIYYNPLLILIFIGLLAALPKRINILIPLQGIVFAVVVGMRYDGLPTVPLITGRGTIYTRPDLAAGYSAAIGFINDKKLLGKRVVVLPEDTSLYFFTGTRAPSRWYSILPGLMEPGRIEDSYTDELKVNGVNYILLTNRSTFEYEEPYFGLDYNSRVYDWIKSNFEVVDQIGNYSTGPQYSKFGALVLSRRVPSLDK